MLVIVNLLKASESQVSLLLFYRWEKLGPERLSCLPKVTQPVCGRVKPRSAWLQSYWQSRAQTQAGNINVWHTLLEDKWGGRVAVNWRMPGSPKHNTSAMHCKHFAGKQNTGGGCSSTFWPQGSPQMNCKMIWWKNLFGRRQKTKRLAPSLLLMSCVNLNKFLNLSGPWLSCL